MNWSVLFFLNSILMGVGLAMDAFSVSLADGLLEPKMSLKRSSAIAGVYAGFQIAMPLLGWICVHTIVEFFAVFEYIVPWIALILLLYIGGKMLYEGMKGSDEENVKKLTVKVLLIQGIATSIDALSVGFAIADYSPIMAIVEALIIGAVTFVICISGLYIGRKIGTRWSSKACILGGIILVGIGIEIFVTGLFF